MKLKIMKKSAIIFLTVFFTSAILGSCEKEVFSEYSEAIMRSYYNESTVLPLQTADSIKSFTRKVDSYVNSYPEAEESEYYPEIIDNIESACATLNLVIKIDTTWAGHIYMKF
jgi:hypothetical protein